MPFLQRPVSLTRLPVSPSPASRRWSAQGHLRAPGQRGFGVADGERHLVLLSAEGQWQPGARLGVPAEARAAALSPDLRHLALLGPDSLEVRTVDGARPPRHTGVASVPAQSALTFDVTGDALWLSGEQPDGHALQLFDTASLTHCPPVFVAGEREGFHELLPHPHEPSVAVSVSCGQDGTWLSFLRRCGAGLEKVGELAGRNEPFFAAGFLADGQSLIGIAGTWVRRWSYPGCQLLAEHVLPEDVMAGYCGAVIGDSVLVPVEHEDRGQWMLYQLDDRTLRLQRRLELPLRSPEVSALHVLPGGHLLSEGHVWRLPSEVVDRAR